MSAPTNQDDQRGQDVPRRLAQEARATEARMLPVEGPLTDDQLRHVAHRLTAFLSARGVEPVSVAEQIGVRPRGNLAKFAAEDFRFGGVVQLARTIDRWLRQQETDSVAGKPVGFVRTQVADEMLGVIQGAFRTRTMAAIVGPSGTSKSVVCRAVASGIIPGAVHVELTQAHGRPAPLARLIAQRTSAPRRSGSLAELLESLIPHLSGAGGPLLIDEAHYLTREGCNVLRDLHKQTGIAVVLVGTREVLATINDFDEFHGQFKSLFSYTLNVTEELEQRGTPLYTVEEVVRFARSMGLRLTSDGAEGLADLVNLLGWGGLRSACMLLLNARLLAEDAPINRKVLMRALREMEGHTGFERVKVRTQQRRTAVA